MHEASYGYPPENPDDVVWLNLREFVARQGADPAAWTIKPHCPHCKCALDTFDIKGTKDFHLISAGVTGQRRKTGFGHPRKQAKPDCPYSYTNDPRFVYPPSRHTAARERQENRKVIVRPSVAVALQEVLRCLMQRMTREATISPQDQKVLNRLGTLVDHTRGLKKYPWMRPYMQVLLFSEHHRRVRSKKTPRKSMDRQIQRRFDESGDASCARGRRSPPARDSIMAWRPQGEQVLTYESVNPEDGSRELTAPAQMQLFFIHPQRNGGVKYAPVLSKGIKPILFDVSRDFAFGFVERARAREVKQEARKKGRIHGRPKPQRTVPGQAQFDFGGGTNKP
jgi:hypothetical protein